MRIPLFSSGLASPFRSNEEFFAAVRALIARLEAAGMPDAAAELKDGFACLNGLTDGSALFLDTIDGLLATRSREFELSELDSLKAIRKAMHAAVYRR